MSGYKHRHGPLCGGPGHCIYTWHEDAPIRNNPFLRSVVDIGKELISDPFGDRWRMEQLMTAGNTIQSAEQEITPASVRDEIESHKEDLTRKLDVTEQRIAEVQMKLEFLEGTRLSLSRAISALEGFLYPQEKIADDVLEGRPR